MDAMHAVKHRRPTIRDWSVPRTPCSEKDDTKLTAVTPSILNRFSKLFYWQTERKMCN